jgi:hypothetical protein
VERYRNKATGIMNLGFLISELRKDHYGICEEIEIAKGKWEIIESWAEAKEQIKRQWLSRK